MLKHLFKNTPRKMVERELEESNMLLLQSHTNMEHWQSQVSLHQSKIKRLTATWNKMQNEDSPTANAKGKDRDD